jgi:hypothetical protein
VSGNPNGIVSVLPLRNTAGWLPPWALNLDTAFIINSMGLKD